MNVISSLLGRNKKNTFSFPIKFHKESNGLVEHGSIYADHTQLGVVKAREPVRFSFGDFDPPALTAELLAHIEDQASRQGYFNIDLRSYVLVFPVLPGPRPTLTSTTPRGRANPSQQRTMRRPSGERADAPH